MQMHPGRHQDLIWKDITNFFYRTSCLSSMGRTGKRACIAPSVMVKIPDYVTDNFNLCVEFLISFVDVLLEGVIVLPAEWKAVEFGIELLSRERPHLGII